MQTKDIVDVLYITALITSTILVLRARLKGKTYYEITHQEVPKKKKIGILFLTSVVVLMIVGAWIQILYEIGIIKIGIL